MVPCPRIIIRKRTCSALGIRLPHMHKSLIVRSFQPLLQRFNLCPRRGFGSKPRSVLGAFPSTLMHYWPGCEYRSRLETLSRLRTSNYSYTENRQFSRCAHLADTMTILKRKPSSAVGSQPASKRSRPTVPEYHLTPSITDEDGDIIWPAPALQIERARDIIIKW